MLKSRGVSGGFGGHQYNSTGCGFTLLRRIALNRPRAADRVAPES
jgi:hypothetical protein